MLKIRLQRTGKRGQAYFRVVVLEHTTKPKGKYLEFLGSYDPHKNELSVKADRVKHWLSVGACLSETVNNLLVDRGLIEGEKVRAWKPKPRRKEVGAPTEASEKKKKKEEIQPKAAPTEETKTQEVPASEEVPPAPPEESSQEAIPEETKTEEAAQAVIQ